MSHPSANVTDSRASDQHAQEGRVLLREINDLAAAALPSALHRLPPRDLPPPPHATESFTFSYLAFLHALTLLPLSVRVCVLSSPSATL